MSPEQLEKYISSSDLKEHEVEWLSTSADKFKAYGDILYRRKLRATEEAFRDYHHYVFQNSIFLKKELKEKFLEMDEVIWSAKVDWEVGSDHNNRGMRLDAMNAIKEKIEPIRDQIESLVQERLSMNNEL